MTDLFQNTTDASAWIPDRMNLPSRINCSSLHHTFFPGEKSESKTKIIQGEFKVSLYYKIVIGIVSNVVLIKLNSFSCLIRTTNIVSLSYRRWQSWHISVLIFRVQTIISANKNTIGFSSSVVIIYRYYSFNYQKGLSFIINCKKTILDGFWVKPSNEMWPSPVRNENLMTANFNSIQCNNSRGNCGKILMRAKLKSSYTRKNNFNG